MPKTLDRAKLALVARGRRGSRSLRAAAEEAGVSHTTIQNVEQANEVGEDATLLILSWIGIPTEFFMAEGAPAAPKEARENGPEEAVAGTA